MEDVLSKFREGQLKVTHEVVTVLFNCLDILESMVGDITDGGDGDLEINNIVTQLVKIAEGNENIQKEDNSSEVIQNKDKEVAQDIMGSEDFVDLGLDEYDIDILKEALKNNFNIFHVHVGLDEKTILKSARAFILFQTLEENGEILKSNPKLEDLESENFDFDIDLVFVTETSQDIIKNSINGISEIRQVEVRDISGLVRNGNSVSNAKEANEIAATALATSTKATNTAEIAKDKESSNKVVELKESKNNLKAKTVETAPKAKEENKKQPVKHKNKGVGQSVRVDLERLDNFMNMVSELVIHRTRLEQISANHKIVELNETLEEVARTTTDLQDLVMKIRMLPLDVVFNRFPRMIRDLSMELNKEIDFEIQGQDTELDRTVIEEIGEPLIHLLRNAADHGVEPAEKRISQGKPAAGKIKLIAYSEGTKAVIKVEDDGSGINVEKVRLRQRKLVLILKV